MNRVIEGGWPLGSQYKRESEQRSYFIKESLLTEALDNSAGGGGGGHLLLWVACLQFQCLFARVYASFNSTFKSVFHRWFLDPKCWDNPYVSLQLPDMGAINNQSNNKQTNSSFTSSPAVGSLLEDLWKWLFGITIPRNAPMEQGREFNYLLQCILLFLDTNADNVRQSP